MYMPDNVSLVLLQVAAVVTQPGKPKGRGNRGVPTPSPVEQLARDLGVQQEAIVCPASAKDVSAGDHAAAFRM